VKWLFAAITYEGSLVVTLSRVYNKVLLQLLNLRREFDLYGAERALRFRYGRTIAKGVAETKVVNQLSQLGGHGFVARLHH
jgi:hypothetical protein